MTHADAMSKGEILLFTELCSHHIAQCPEKAKFTSHLIRSVSVVSGKFGMARVLRAFSRFRRETEGTVSFEFMIWIPLVFGLLVTVLDFSHALTVKSSMWHEARVAARGLSMHAMSESAARSHIRDGLAWSAADYTVDIERDRSRVYVTVRTPMKTSGLIDFATARLSGDWVARVMVLAEPV